MRVSRKATTALAALVLTMAGSAGAESGRQAEPPEGIVWYVLDVLNGLHLDVDDPTNRPPLLRELPDGVLTAVEVSADGRPDWLIAWPQNMAFCGTGGCRHTLYVSTPDGFVRAFDRQAFGLEVERVGQGVRVEATVHSIYCADDRPDCRRVWLWDETGTGLHPAADQPGDPLPPVDPDITG